MKIYQLIVNQVAPDPMTMISSSYRSTRFPKLIEYYQSKESAESRKSEIYNGVKSIIGFIDNIEVEIKEIEVKP